MKKTILVLLMLTVLLSLFFGCQPTPNEPFVIAKDQQEMLDAAREGKGDSALLAGFQPGRSRGGSFYRAIWIPFCVCS